MAKKFGQFRQDRPEGMLRPVVWPQLAMVDSRTPDGRLIRSDGFGTRTLPRPFYAQFDNDGHYGAKLVGSVDEVTLEDDGTISGRGWVLDDENGHNLVRYNLAGALRTNSVDLADVEAEVKWGSDDPEDEGFWELEGVDFIKANIGATTAVGMPAFPDAQFELPEMKAALVVSDEPIEIIASASIHVPAEEAEVTTPDTVPWDDFNIPEADEPHKIVVDRDGRVFGHLATWDQPHRGYDGRARYCPRPSDGYTEFNHAGPLTEQGQVGTGPVFLLGGHPNGSMRGRSQEEIEAAYGGIENAWADVRVTEGKFGPWISGRVRPGLSDDKLYAARCSHVSGHWIGDKLVAITSVNVPGFLPGAGFSAQHEDGLLELVAGFVPPQEQTKLQYFAPTVVERLAAAHSELAAEPEPDFEHEMEVLEIELAMLDDDDD